MNSNIIVRRDPRAERIRRNRLHPRHHEFCQPAARWMGPNGVMRRNPHVTAAIGPNGLRRLDRSGATVTAGASSHSVNDERHDQRRQVTLESPAFLVAVVPECPEGRLSSHDRDLLGLARQIADRDPASPGAVLAITFDHNAPELADAGADRWLALDDDGYAGYSPESRLTALETVERCWSPHHWLLPDGPAVGSDLGRRLAVRLAQRNSAGEEARAATRVWQVDKGYCLCRGGGGHQDIRRPLPHVVLALTECAEPVSDTRHEARVVTLDTTPVPSIRRVTDHGRVAVDPSRIALDQAPFILAGGRGIGDWAGFHETARLLGAAEGASRVAVDDGYMPRARQVGATGTFVTAGCYIAVGISGAVQHLQGIERCQRVVAINSDPGCDMVRRADLALIGDGDAILAALAVRLGASQQEEYHHDVA
ncbi:electron transfer flavoprotein subunit alpha/FixB family protein [Kushneria phosphatilytica]|uniref:Electron transfer flavoprotein subunit alpha/FixB family protein n=1 Tax=Kushneria phosphatilytica TaxID=657387 RepID=A0A1S1NWY2_9GAMM|nr:electron transfer flavoprotein subunit alpha/FixB family protein [Kushneria phosphatilytica]OHV12766.1 electron transfer flavoprotein subunit alpha [Kushneria phosphatilytica]QEL10607.1 electron transfer flavoprotein subunit alpha/FixB family protein [Kushneria phosphatilytica]